MEMTTTDFENRIDALQVFFHQTYINWAFPFFNKDFKDVPISAVDYWAYTKMTEKMAKDGVNNIKALNLEFDCLFLFSNENNIFFEQCSFNAYKSTFESRFSEYKKTFVDTSLIDFVKMEMLYLRDASGETMLFNVLNDTNKKRVSDSKKNKIKFLENKFKSVAIETQQPEPLDLSNTSAVEKIIYLEELGIIDFLKTKPEFILSTNLMATFLSAITDEKAGTLQPSLNKLINEDTEDKNHPYRTINTVNKVRQTLIDKNITPKTS